MKEELNGNEGFLILSVSLLVRVPTPRSFVNMNTSSFCLHPLFMFELQLGVNVKRQI